MKKTFPRSRKNELTEMRFLQQLRWKKKHRTHRNSNSNITFMYMNSKSPLCPLHEHFQPIFSSFGKVFGTRTWAMMSWLRNASCLLTQFVLLLGDSRPGLFLTGPGSKMACGLDLIHSDVNEHRGMCLFWGGRSHRPRVETYARRVSFSHTHWLPQG